MAMQYAPKFLDGMLQMIRFYGYAKSIENKCVH